MHFGSDSAGYDFSQTKWKKRSATSRLHPRLQSKTIKAVGPIEERPGGRVGLPLILCPSGERVRATVAHRSESASGDEVIQPGDHPRPRMLSRECAGEHLVDCQLKGSGV